MSNAVFTLTHDPSGQAYISSKGSVYIHQLLGPVKMDYKGSTLVFKQHYSEESFDSRAFAAAVKANFPGVQVRRGATWVHVKPSKDMLNVKARLVEEWQGWVKAGMSHNEMVHKVINDTDFRRIVDAQ